jgi:hypothetical protein
MGKSVVCAPSLLLLACEGELFLRVLCGAQHAHTRDGHRMTERANTPPPPAPSLQALFDLEATNAELKADLRDLYITSAKEVDVSNSNRKAIIVHVSPARRA